VVFVSGRLATKNVEVRRKMDSLCAAGRGHEIWVLAEWSHGHPGHPVPVRIFYGHAMHPDGLADLTRLRALAVGPGGETAEVSLEAGERDFHRAVFTPEREGIWTLAVEYDVGPLVLTPDGQWQRGTRRDAPDAREAAYYYQYAKTHIPVGHLGHEHHHDHGHAHGHCHCAGHGHDHDHHGEEVPFLGHRLEIGARPAFCRKGQEVTVEVRHRGLPLPGADLHVTWSFYERKQYPFQVRTDAAGRATVPLRAEGHWLFYVRCEDGPEGRDWDRTVYSATLTIFGVR